MEYYHKLLDKLRRSDAKEPPGVKLIGYSDIIAQIKQQIAINENFLVTGPSGVGKTTVIRQIIGSRKLSLIYIDVRWFMRKQFGDIETQLDALIQTAVEKAPSVVFLDRIDSIACIKRNQSDLDKRILITLIDQLIYLASTTDKKILVIAATDCPEQLDKQVTNFFPEEIRFPIPCRADRLEKLRYVFPHFSVQELETIADATHCYLFKDLDKLRLKSLNSNLKLNFNSVMEALKTFKPKTIKDYTTPYPPLKWDDIGGMNEVKRDLEETVIEPLRDRQRGEELSFPESKGVLLYGPPGCSKTMLAQALATESGYNFIAVKGPELFTKYVGDTEAAVRKLYRNAREIAPCIIFFDEIDGLASERTDNHGSSVNEKVVTQILTEFNGPPDDVFTIAATNRPERVDSALLRPGRLDSTIYIPLPSKDDRAEIFKVHMRPIPVKFDKPLAEVTEELALKTKGYSGADIEKICRSARRCARRENKNKFIELRHFNEAINNVQPSVRSVRTFEQFYKRGLDEGQRPSLAGDPTRNLRDKFNDSLNLD